MGRGWIAGGVAGLVFVATPAIAVALAVAGGAGSDAPAAAPLRPAAEGDADPGEETGPDEGVGPPAWAKDKERAGKAKAGKERAHQGRDAAWKQTWKRLTPEQRVQRMTDLAKAHAEGMREFGACADAAGDDAAERRACTKPLPPGLAKKRS
jgi:hypothetical protein